MKTIALPVIAFVAISAAALGQNVLFSEDFENGLASWTADDLWHLEDESETCGSLVAPFHSSTKAAYFGRADFCDYQFGGIQGTLTLNQPVQLGSAGDPISLSFWSWHASEGCHEGFDCARVQVSVSGGRWQNVALETSTHQEWRRRWVDLSTYAGSSVSLRFLFFTGDQFQNMTLGWLIDDVRIDQGPGQAFCGTTDSGCPCNLGSSLLFYEHGNYYGCYKSTQDDSQGSALFGEGVSSVSNDSLVLFAQNLPLTTSALFVQGNPNGAPAFLGDGRLCVSGQLIRLRAVLTSDGTAMFPQPGDPSISQLGLVPPTGGTRAYQVVYRDAAANYCTSSTFNTSNGYRVAWLP